MENFDCSKSNEFQTSACFSEDNASLCSGARNSSLADNFWISLTVLRLHICKQSVRHVSATKYLWTITSIGWQLLVRSNIFALFLFLFISHYLKKVSMDPVHDRASMDPVHESGPWTWSKVGVHGPLVHVWVLTRDCYISSVTSVNLKKAGMASRNIVVKNNTRFKSALQ